MHALHTDKLPISNILRYNVPLADKNWFRTGGVAAYYAEPSNGDEFACALAFAQQEKLELFILGQGANVLISDEGYSGLVLKPNLKEIEISDFDEHHVLVHAGAGVQMPDLISYCLANNSVGLEEFSGIPGTVGGSVYINLHYFEFLF